MRRYIPKSAASKLIAAKRYGAKRRADPEFREKHKQYMREYRRKNKERLRKNDAIYQKLNALEIRLKRKGLAPEAYQKTVEEHHGLCDLCGRKPDGRWKKLNIDHCHKTGRFRGLLCFACNRAIGYFRDDPDLLRRAANYVQYRKMIPGEADILGGAK